MASHPFLSAGAASGFVAVAAGAFGAHALKARLPPDLLVTFEVGARYQMYHALALCLVGLLAGQRTAADGALSAAGWLFCAGTVIFSGSLYLLALLGQRWLGAITPIGGLCLLGGWLALLFSVLRARS